MGPEDTRGVSCCRAGSECLAGACSHPASQRTHTHTHTHVRKGGGRWPGEGPQMTARQGLEGQATRGTPEDAVDKSRIIETSEAARETSPPQGLGNHPGVQHHRA